MQRIAGTYDTDLAYIHDVGFGAFARNAAPGLLAILRRAGVRDGCVVDLGCGSGIWARELVAAGYNVVGIDLSPAMIALARRRVPQGDFRAESLVTARLPSCRAVTCLGEPFNFLFDERGPQRLGEVFRRVYAALAPGGVFIFDVAEPGRNADREVAYIEGDDWACAVRFETDRVKRQLTRHIVAFRKVGRHYRRSEEVHRLQLYRSGELLELLRAAGFRARLVRKYGDFPLPQATVGVIARKA
jgi:SAM-dependent methyltransferase